MANLVDSHKFSTFDDYYTPKSAWEYIAHLIPKDKIIWEAFCLNSKLSKSINNLKELGFNVVGNTELDFFNSETRPKYDMIVSNPPFDKNIKIPILKRLVADGKPFILIMNSMNIYSNYFNEIFADNKKYLQLIIPRGKIYFEKLEGDITILRKNTSFYCVYVCFKMNIPNEKLWIG
jgi:hypothetical protein